MVTNFWENVFNEYVISIFEICVNAYNGNDSEKMCT